MDTPRMLLLVDRLRRRLDQQRRLLEEDLPVQLADDPDDPQSPDELFEHELEGLNVADKTLDELEELVREEHFAPVYASHGAVEITTGGDES